MKNYILTYKDIVLSGENSHDSQIFQKKTTVLHLNSRKIFQIDTVVCGDY